MPGTQYVGQSVIHKVFCIMCDNTITGFFSVEGFRGGTGSQVTLSRELLLSSKNLTKGDGPAGIPTELRKQYSKDKQTLCRTTCRKTGRRWEINRRLKGLSIDNRRRLPPLPTVPLSDVQSTGSWSQATYQCQWRMLTHQTLSILSSVALKGLILLIIFPGLATPLYLRIVLWYLRNVSPPF